MTETQDRLTELLRAVAPPAQFPAERVRERIERGARRHSWKRGAMLWGFRAAAAAAFFFAGSFYAGRAATDIGLRQLRRIDGISEATPRMPNLNASLPLSIQQNGSSYVASLAALTELRDRMTPEEREVARQVAISVLAGAIAELAVAGDGRLPPEIVLAVQAYAPPRTY